MPVTKKTRNSWLAIFLAAIMIMGTCYHLLNKGPMDIGSQTAISISAIDLYAEFKKDNAGATKKYAGKVLAVDGNVSDTGRNHSGQQVVSLVTGSTGTFVNCTFEKNILPVKPGNSISLKGICSGMGDPDPDLGLPADVYLTRCQLLQR